MIIKGDNTFLSLPDFLIIGGARCGTSSLYSQLKVHPEIFMPDIKEPLFFDNLTLNKPPHPKWPPWTIERYAKLFEPARPEQKLGEASASYLFSHDIVIPTLRSIYGEKAREVKIVMILRNPIDRAWSHYILLRRGGIEMSFYELVDYYRYEEEKTYHDLLSSGFYTEQVQGYLGAFDSVQIFMFEELKRNPAAVIRSIFELVGVNDTGFVPWNINTTYNASGFPKSGLSRFAYNFLFHNFTLKSRFKHIVPLNWRLWIKTKIGAKVMKKVEMPADVREFLNKSYQESMKSLRDLLPDPAQKEVVDQWIK